ncbi:MAG: hypothetical protein ACXAC7_04875 [Candidatus Hodarchaeales archaeon]|jgi:hypothetical protein
MVKQYTTNKTVFQCVNCHLWIDQKWAIKKTGSCLFCDSTAYTNFIKLVTDLNPERPPLSREKIIVFTLQEKNDYIKKYGKTLFNKLFSKCQVIDQKEQNLQTIQPKLSKKEGLKLSNEEKEKMLQKKDVFLNIFYKFNLTLEQTKFISQNPNIKVDEQGFYVNKKGKRVTYKDLENMMKKKK